MTKLLEFLGGRTDRHYLSVTWLLLVIVAVPAWFTVTMRLIRSWGITEAATPIALVAATVVTVTLWRWALDDHERAALNESNCPRCRSSLREGHTHARPNGVTAGIQRWNCEQCDYERVDPLTCPGCAA